MPTFTQRISTTNNDGTWAGSWYPNGATWLLVGWNTYLTHEHYSGLRFINVAVPQGSIITSATIQLTSEQTDTNAVDTRIYGIAEDNTSDMSTDPITRAETTAYVDVNFPSGTTGGATYSWDVTSVVQEIVNRTGWANGNAMGFMLRNNSGTANNVALHFYSLQDSASLCAYITITYSSPSVDITKSLQYTVVKAPTPVQQLLRYSILDQELTPVAFSGLKVAKAGHNVLNTKNPNNLNFSSDYNTLKYYLSGVASIAVNESTLKNTYTLTVAVNHNLNFYPVCLAYVQDDNMTNPQPLGRFQAGSGAYHAYSYYITQTQIVFVLNGYWQTTPETFNAYFYYKIFKNDLGL